ncbi:MAG: ABC transporter permease [Prevotella sp.]|jgi:ABC-2 type transport system permease protein|nr:ABC transporter permease [Prevotella sp.]MCI1281057.1 ABC transporter permease [Prevotella sp.]
MKYKSSTIRRIQSISRREIRTFSRRPLFLFCMIIAPLTCIFFFTSLMKAGLPTRLPAAVVDEDNTHITRIMLRMMDSFEDVNLTHIYRSFGDARQAMQRGEIYGFFYLPKGITKEAESSRKPRVSFYTNDAYYVPGNLLMKDMKTCSELIGLALVRANLWANGYTEHDALGIIQPIVIEAHPMKNSFLDYSVYLNNMLVPGIIILLIMLSTTYCIGMEWKNNRQKVWFWMAGESVWVALIGKLLPQTVVYSIIMIFMDVVFFRYLGYPCNCGIAMMMFISVLTVLSSQGFGVFLFGLMAGEMRLAMCICSLWGILSFSLAGFTYPVTAMNPFLRALAVWFPLRHYYLMYVDLALDGYSIRYVLDSLCWMIGFCLLPFLTTSIYHKAFLKYEYLK